MNPSRWWTLVVRGIAAILFGILAFARPGISLFFLVMLWGAYALVDGIFALIMSVKRARRGSSWGWLLFGGIVSICAGALTFFWPQVTGLALLVVIGSWAIVTGTAEIFLAIGLRRQLEGEWRLGASGVLSIAFGAILLIRPGSGALAVVWIIGSYAILFGALLISLGLRLHRWHRAGERPVPHGGTPTLA